MGFMIKGCGLNQIIDFVYNRDHDAIHKFPHYFEIYDRFFSRFRGTSPCVVEIGVADGGSLQLWKDYFGPGAQIFGVDISADINKKYDQITIIQGDQGDGKFLRQLPGIIGRPIDILIDDGSHFCKDQVLTLGHLYNSISENGIYVCEDVQTSYQEQFGGGYRRPYTLIETVKGLVDELNAWCAEPNTELARSNMMKTLYAIHFYTYMIVVEKRSMGALLRSPVQIGGVHGKQEEPHEF